MVEALAAYRDVTITPPDAEMVYQLREVSADERIAFVVNTTHRVHTDAAIAFAVHWRSRRRLLARSGRGAVYSFS